MKRNFKEVYEKIYKETKEEIDELKAQNTSKIIKTLLIIVVIVIAMLIASREYKQLRLIIVGAGILISAVSIAIEIDKYKEIYKSKVITTMVHGYSDKLFFSPMSSMTKSEYNSSQFDLGYDEFYTEDEIAGRLEDGSRIKMAQIRTIEETETTDSDGHTQRTRTETFKGMYGFVELKNVIIPNHIEIISNSFFHRYNRSRIEMESSEFEKKYDIIAHDKINATQIFTSDLIEKFIELSKNKRYILQMRIMNSKIYFRFRCGDVFEPPMISSGISFDLLYKYFSIVNLPIEIIEQIIKNAKAIKGEYD